MKYQALFSSKDKSKKLKCGLMQFLLGLLRVNFYISNTMIWFGLPFTSGLSAVSQYDGKS